MHIQTCTLSISFAFPSQPFILPAPFFALQGNAAFSLTPGPKSSGTATWKTYVSNVTPSAQNLSGKGAGDSWGNRPIILLYIFKGTSATPSHGSLWEFPTQRSPKILTEKEEQ